MTGMVSGERANFARLTGGAGLLVLGGAVAMMAMAAPSQVHPRAPAAVAVSVTLAAQSGPRSATELRRQLTSTTAGPRPSGPARAVTRETSAVP